MRSFMWAFILSAVSAFAAQAQQACFFEDVGYNGRYICLNPNEQINNLNGYFNDLISSLSVPAGTNVVVCTNANFGGSCLRFYENAWDLRSYNFNDSISSIRMEWGGYNPPPPPPPQLPPPAQGTPVAMLARVSVGCQGRVEQVTLRDFTLFQDSGNTLYFRSTVQVAHKCDGKTKFIGADAVIGVPRRTAKVSSAGVLLSPAINASIQCDGRTAWLNAPCVSATLTQ